MQQELQPLCRKLKYLYDFGNMGKGEGMEDYFQIGIITAPHGLRGETKVYPTTDDARRYKRLKDRKSVV